MSTSIRDEIERGDMKALERRWQEARQRCKDSLDHLRSVVHGTDIPTGAELLACKPMPEYIMRHLKRDAGPAAAPAPAATRASDAPSALDLLARDAQHHGAHAAHDAGEDGKQVAVLDYTDSYAILRERQMNGGRASIDDKSADASTDVLDLTGGAQ